MVAAILSFREVWFSPRVQRSVPVGERSAGRVFRNLVSAWIYGQNVDSRWIYRVSAPQWYGAPHSLRCLRFDVVSRFHPRKDGVGWGRIALLRAVPAWHGGLGFLPRFRFPTGTSG